MHLCVREVALRLPRRLRKREPDLIDLICAKYGHDRLTLPQLDVEAEFPGFTDLPVTVRALPRHLWTSPLTDQIALAKIAALTRPTGILEVGSFEGHTALMLAENTDAQITTVDPTEDHGVIYRGTALEQRIHRHVGTLETLPNRGPYDLIFLDADHNREAVRRDTRLALKLLAPGGVFAWHDYCDSYWVSQLNRVPEVLAEYARTLPVHALPGTRLALYRAPV